MENETNDSQKLKQTNDTITNDEQYKNNKGSDSDEDDAAPVKDAKKVSYDAPVKNEEIAAVNHTL